MEVLFVVSLPAYLTTVWLQISLKSEVVPRTGFGPADARMKTWCVNHFTNAAYNKFLFLVLTRGHNATIDLQTVTYLGLERHQSGHRAYRTLVDQILRPATLG